LQHHQVPPASAGQKSEALRINGGVLQNKLRHSVRENNLKTRQRVRDAVAREMISSTSSDVAVIKIMLMVIIVGRDEDGWQKLRIMPALLRIFTHVSLASFIGEDEGIITSTLPRKHDQ
jgi:hypothetical protein